MTRRAPAQSVLIKKITEQEPEKDRRGGNES